MAPRKGNDERLRSKVLAIHLAIANNIVSPSTVTLPYELTPPFFLGLAFSNKGPWAFRREIVKRPHHPDPKNGTSNVQSHDEDCFVL